MYGGVCIFIHKKVSMFYSALDDILKLFLQIVIPAYIQQTHSSTYYGNNLENAAKSLP